MAMGSSGFRESLPFLLCPSVSGWLALDCVTYLPGAQEHRHEVPEPCAQPNQQSQGPQEPRAAAERAQWGHLCRAHCQDDSRGEAWGWDLCTVGREARLLQLCAGLRGGGFWLHEDEPGASYSQTVFSDSSCLKASGPSGSWTWLMHIKYYFKQFRFTGQFFLHTN